ncbi:MAG: hypothetical protein HXY20_15235 [Acidobacteria bacterium]|nr:hypothetical protein [Acidobacteriota bacterium]
MRSNLLQAPDLGRKSTWRAARINVVLQPPEIDTYAQRPWIRRLPAVLLASLALLVVLMAVGVTLDSVPLLVLVPLLGLPVCVALALHR